MERNHGEAARMGLLRWAIGIAALALAGCCGTERNVAHAVFLTGMPSECPRVIVRITNTTDWQWSRIDTVQAVYRELTHTTTLGLDGKPRLWPMPFVVEEIGTVETEGGGR